MAHLHNPNNFPPALSIHKRRRPLWMRLLTMFGALLALCGAIFVYWALNTAAPMEPALAALQSTSQVEVLTEPWLVFRPLEQEVEQGFIFYPGGRVDARAYTPMAQELANAGILVVIPSMPLNLAVLAPNRAQEIIDFYPEISHWAMGGHSLGGTMSATFALAHPELIQKLVLLASYPANSLAEQSGLAVLSIYGTSDGLIPLSEIEEKRSLLPADTHYVPIEGGNHAQFGWYGPQSGDNPATIERANQQAQTVQAIKDFLLQ